MQQRENGLRGLFLVLVLLLRFSQAIGAATLFPNRSRGWNKIPTIVVSLSKLWLVPNSSISSEEIVAVIELRR